jgi:hypothetical protein
MALPVYDPGGTRQTQPQRLPQVSADDFGGMQARAMTQAGNALQQVGGNMLQIEERDRQRDAAAKILNATNSAADTMREKLYGPGGIMEQTGVNADGASDRVAADLKKIREEQSGNFQTPEEKAAFENTWTQYENSMLDNVEKHEFTQRQAVRTTAKTAALSGLEADAIASYDNPDALGNVFDLARKTIRANPDGLPPEAVSELERQSVSALHLQVVQRMAQDDPGKALDYYESHKGEVSGTDHAQAQKLIGAISNIREVRTTVEEAIGSGPAADVVRAVIGAESEGRADAVSEAGAAGLMQLMPETAREVARSLGLQHVAEMDDSQLQEYWQTPAGKSANVRMGTAYLGTQIKKFGGDLEAALIAYNAGPANAVKFLNSGRDYTVLPKMEETLPYVKKVMAAYRGVEIQGDTSADIQGAVNGTTKKYYNGDSKAFLKERLQKQHGPDHVDGLSTDMSDRLAAMIAEAPDNVKAGLDIMSGARSIERQQQLWDASDKSGKWVARPGGSKHNHGVAADLGWNGGRFSAAPKEVREWVHANAEKYGLTFPMSYEPWHIETAEARKGARVVEPAKGGRVERGQTTTDAAAIQGRIESAWSDIEVSGLVELMPQAASASDLYTKTVSPFTVGAEPSLEGALSHVREIYADNPVKLAEAERQITDQIKTQQAAGKAQIDGLKKEVLRGIIGGQKVRDFDPLILEQIGSEGVSQLITLESKFAPGGDDKTDDATYIKLVNMTPEEFKSVDLIDFADKLSGGDLRAFADKQAELVRPNASKALENASRTRTQIVSEAQNILGLDPGKEPDDAMRMATLNRALDLKIAAHVETSGKEPTGLEIQTMVDDLLLEGRIAGTGLISDDKARAFELTPEQRSKFYTAETVDDIAPEIRPAVVSVYRKIWGTTAPPGEEEAVAMYNDMVRVDLGGAPSPPSALDAKIRQGLARSYGRPASTEEVANFYREWLKRAKAGK